MGGVTGLMRCAAICEAHGVELVPHQDAADDRPYGQTLHVCAVLPHAIKPCEWDDPSSRRHVIFDNPPKPKDALFHLPNSPGLGLAFIEGELERRRIAVA